MYKMYWLLLFCGFGLLMFGNTITATVTGILILSVLLTLILINRINKK
jgi:hypothetical protein